MTRLLLALALVACADAQRPLGLRPQADETTPDLAATIYSAACAVLGGQAVDCGTDYRGNRAAHDYDVHVAGWPSTSVHIEGIGESTGFLRYYFFSYVTVDAPACDTNISGRTLHQAWWTIGAPTGAFGYAQLVVYFRDEAPPCCGGGNDGTELWPMSCGGSGGGGGGGSGGGGGQSCYDVFLDGVFIGVVCFDHPL